MLNLALTRSRLIKLNEKCSMFNATIISRYYGLVHENAMSIPENSLKYARQEDIDTSGW